MKKVIDLITSIFLLLFLFCSCSSLKTIEGNRWKLVWSENFESQRLDTTIWSKIPRNKADWGNYMSDDDRCYNLQKGKLFLKGIKNDLPDDTAAYLTGGVWTKDKKYFENGRLEIYARLPLSKGAWPAFWMLPDAPWPVGGEIDIMEHLNFDDYVYQTVHSNYTIKRGEKKNPLSHAIAKINPKGFNIYAVELSSDSLVFYVNDIRVFTYPRISTMKTKGQYPFAQPYYLLLDMQLGGRWVGKVDAEALPIEMEIDWVRFYRLKGKVKKSKMDNNMFISGGVAGGL